MENSPATARDIELVDLGTKPDTGCCAINDDGKSPGPLAYFTALRKWKFTLDLRTKMWEL